MTSTIADRDRPSEIRTPVRSPFGLALVPVFLIVLATLLAGYMFLGRGLAHLGRSPIYVGEVVLVIGVITASVAFARLRLRRPLLPVIWLLLGFVALGLARTIPYLGVFGVDALRDAVLWGYAAFAFMIYVLADRAVALGALRLYGWVVPIFALWLPVSYSAFAVLSSSIRADELGSNVPIVFFKSGDMAVHIVGSLAFLVIAAGAVTNVRTFAWRLLIALPLLWAVLVVGSTNRGGLLTVAAGIVIITSLAILFHRSSNWRPLLVAPAVLAIGLGVVWISGQVGTLVTAPGSEPESIASGSPTASPPDVTPRPAATCEAAPASRSLIANPGFELGTLNSGTIHGWAIWAGTYNIVGGGAYRGANYASMQNTGEAWSATVTTTGFPVLAGDVIAVSLWTKAIEGRPSVATYVNWYDSTDSRISSVFLSFVETNGRRTWQESKGAITAPLGTIHATVQIFESSGNATIGLDEVIVKGAIKCEAAPASRSLIANPGFELGTLNSGTIQGWATWAGRYNIVEGRSYRGANYASLQNTGAAWSATITSAGFPVLPGDGVSVSLVAKAIDGRPVIATYVNWYDSTDARISSVFVNSVETYGRRTWQEITGAITAPDGTTHATVQLFEASGNATIGLDEIIVKTGHSVVPPPPAPKGRSTTIDQIIKNIASIFSPSSDENLEGSKEFRLRWWGSIVNYTVFGDYFWTGKGFGVNLADVDGFQANADGSLRSPHNSHITALARMGVPGFILWLLLQGAFGIGLVRSVLAQHRAGMTSLAIVGAWILAYWVAMLVDTSFDPYLEGPQGGIWFWSLFGLGMVVMRLSPRSPEG